MTHTTADLITGQLDGARELAALAHTDAEPQLVWTNLDDPDAPMLVDLDRCEVDDCDSTDDVQAELLSWGNRIDPPEYLYVCAHHRALQDAALEHLAEDRAADRAYGYDDPSLDYR